MDFSKGIAEVAGASKDSDAAAVTAWSLVSAIDDSRNDRKNRKEFTIGAFASF
jgi:hypothetical protein